MRAGAPVSGEARSPHSSGCWGNSDPGVAPRLQCGLAHSWLPRVGGGHLWDCHVPSPSGRRAGEAEQELEEGQAEAWSCPAHGEGGSWAARGAHPPPKVSYTPRT